MSVLILVADDESDVEDLFRQQFRRDLRAGRFTMDFAQSGDGALQRIRDAAGASLIPILSDINMPGMSGLELLPKAKAARPDVPVNLITAYGDADTRRKALEGGAEALLTKPIDFVALRSEIDNHVPRGWSRGPLRARLRRTHCEHMFSALPSNSDIARCSQHVSKVPTTTDIRDDLNSSPSDAPHEERAV